MYTEEIKRFHTAVNSVVDNVDKTYLRDLQADSHECAANCCRDKESSTVEVLRCVENCGEKLETAKKIVMGEFDRLDDKFERCISSCHEFVRDSTGKEAHGSSMLNGCVRQCVDANIEIIPVMMKAIKDAITNDQ